MLQEEVDGKRDQTLDWGRYHIQQPVNQGMKGCLDDAGCLFLAFRNARSLTLDPAQLLQ